MKVKFLKLKNWLFLSLLGSLGLGSCASSKQATTPTPDEKDKQPTVQPRNEMRLMYGVPTMNFRLSGRVQSPKGKPVEGIRVTMLEPGMEVQADTIVGDPERVEAFLETQGVRTDSHGHFELQQSGRPSSKVRLMVTDTDGSHNGSYRSQVVDVKVDPANLDRTSAAGFNQGTLIQEVNVELEKK